MIRLPVPVHLKICSGSYENYNEEKLSTEIQDEEMFCFFAAHDGEPVGYLQFKEDYKNFPEIKKWKALELKRIYVLKAFHGKGIAQKLMDHYIDFAREKNLKWPG
ncbi:MAG: GNAT family N-acetyltransferase [Chitinophagaceae bacterium]|nr:GNAT family N-acetyltransferase [Chitinophagaceae bacterium]